MAGPKTLRQRVRERTRKAINRALERDQIAEEEVQAAADAFDLSDYNTFFGECREAGKTTERCGALWNRLKERGIVPTGTSSSAGGGSTSRSGSPDTPAADLDGLEDEIRGVDAAYLIVTDGCPSCAQAKEVLSGFIDAGTIEPVDPAESGLGADIVLETDLDQVPTLVVQDNGQFREI